MKAFLTNFLGPLSDWIYDKIVAVPLPLVRFFFLGMLAVLAIWVFSLHEQRAVDDNGNKQAWYTDLRVMAICLLALQSIFYILL